MPLPEYRARELIQNVGIVSGQGTGAGLKQLGIGLGAVGERIGLEEEREAVARARVEGGNAVTRDAQGQIQIEPLDFSSPVARARTEAAIKRFEDEHELDARRVAAVNRTRFQTDPEGFANFARGHKEGVLQQVPQQLKGQIAARYDNIFGQTFSGLLTSKQARDDAIALGTYNQVAQVLLDDIWALDAQGMSGSKAKADAVGKFEEHLLRGKASGYLNDEGINLARQKMADVGEVKALSYLATQEAKTAYFKNGNASDALEALERGINRLKDPDLKLPERIREEAATDAKREFNQFLTIQSAHKSEAENARVLADREKREAQDKTGAEFLIRLRDRTLTTQDIDSSNLDSFGQGSKQTFYELITRQATMTVTDPEIYKDVRRQIFDGKINTAAQLLPYVGKGLSVDESQRLETDINQMNTAKGKAEASVKKSFLDMSEKLISPKSGLLGNISDPVGEKKFFLFQRILDDVLAKGVEEGKSIQSMLHPESKDYIGGMIQRFMRSPTEKMRDQMDQFRKGAKEPEARKEGESIADWRKRTGK